MYLILETRNNIKFTPYIKKNQTIIKNKLINYNYEYDEIIKLKF